MARKDGLQLATGRPRGQRSNAPIIRDASQRTRDAKPDRPRGTAQDRGVPRNRELFRDQSLSREQLRSVADLGVFRAIRPADLRLDPRQLNELKNAALVREFQSRGEKYLTLTREGCSLARVTRLAQPDLKLYSGPRKLQDATHDSAIYTAYSKAVAEIEAKGGRVTSIARDEDLRRDIYRDRQTHPEDDQKTVAERHHVAADNGKYVLPDLQIHYEMPAPDAAPGQDLSHGSVSATANIEIVTDSYRGDDIASKSDAGFTLVAAGGVDLGAIAAQQTGGGGVPVYSLADDIINF
jgi:hypothetical protein